MNTFNNKKGEGLCSIKARQNLQFLLKKLYFRYDLLLLETIK